MTLMTTGSLLIITTSTQCVIRSIYILSASTEYVTDAEARESTLNVRHVTRHVTHPRTCSQHQQTLPAARLTAASVLQ